MPKVSVCIPAYNQVKYLKKTIDSVLMQTYSDYEIIITDDSVTDIVKHFVSTYNRGDIIKYFKNPLKLGTPENWNEAIRKSSGEYIKILHHDDWLNYDDSLAKYVALLDENPEVDLAFSNTIAAFPNGEQYESKLTNVQINMLQANPASLYIGNIIGAPSTTIFKRTEEAVFFETKLKWLVDIEFYMRKLKHNNHIGYSNEPLVTTFAAEGRVSDYCKESKIIEVKEYFYLLQSLETNYNLTKKELNGCLLKAITICIKYNVINVSQIREIGYTGHIHFIIRNYLFLKKRSGYLSKLFLKFIT